jgi:hypothetical protein
MKITDPSLIAAIVAVINTEDDTPDWHGPGHVIDSIHTFPAIAGEADEIIRVIYRPGYHMDINMNHYPILRAVIHALV